MLLVSRGVTSTCSSLQDTAVCFSSLIRSAIIQRSASGLATMSCEENIYSAIQAASGVYKFYCNGQWLESASGKSVPVINPTTEEKDYAVQGSWGFGRLLLMVGTCYYSTMRPIQVLVCVADALYA